MDASDSQLSTFERSCQHWSEQGRVGMDAFYRLASYDYRLLAEQLRWGQVLSEVKAGAGPEFGLLDVACGSGQFPNALLQYGGLESVQELRIQYSLLDPSEFSIEAARAKLAPPFVAGDELKFTAQDIPIPQSPYSAVWATHALYCVPASEIDVAIERMVAVMDPKGLGFIAHASQHAHYLKFQELYLGTAQGQGAEPYSTGEQVLAALQSKLGGENVEAWAIDYEGTLELDDRATAERYLQRCLFDDNLSLDAMFEIPSLAEYLGACRDEAAGLWRFPQRTWLMFYGESAQKVSQWRRD